MPAWAARLASTCRPARIWSAPSTPPQLVLADPYTLNTLPPEEVSSGMAEVVKHGVISDPKLFELCAGGMKHIQGQWTPLISRAMAVKVQVIQEDPYEQGRAGGA